SPGAHVQPACKPVSMKQGEQVAYAVLHVFLATTLQRLVLFEESGLLEVVDIAVQVATRGKPGARGDLGASHPVLGTGRQRNDPLVNRGVIEQRIKQLVEFSLQLRGIGKEQAIDTACNGLAATHEIQVVGNTAQHHVELQQVRPGELDIPR